METYRKGEVVEEESDLTKAFKHIAELCKQAAGGDQEAMWALDMIKAQMNLNITLVSVTTTKLEIEAERLKWGVRRFDKTDIRK